MNGGTIPTNREQVVTFFNTTGVIERHKNIYFVPRFTKHNLPVGRRISVADAYRIAFNEVCPPSSIYRSITISSWSPQDRTLTVQGNIDDFRCITDEGECLNYLIIDRTVKKGNVDSYFHYAFFITDAKQSGGSSITLTIIPDDFTNAFYLHNKTLYSSSMGDYEPFNEHMKNCYVKRQHYNRVKYEQEELEFDNIKTFLNTQESFTFKYQYRDKKDILVKRDSSVLFSDYEKGLISDNQWINLPDSLKTKIIKSSLSWAVVELKSTQGTGKFVSHNGGSVGMRYYAYGPFIKGVARPNLLIYFPFFNIPNLVKDYERDIIEYTCYLFNGNERIILSNGYDLFRNLGLEAMANNIYDVYIVSDACIPDNRITIDNTNSEIIFTVINTFSSPSTNYSVPVEMKENNIYPALLWTKQSVSGTDGDIIKTYPAGSITYPTDAIIGLIPTFYSREYNLTLFSPIPLDIKNLYFDPVLEAEPYKFYSISTLSGFELPFNKNRYFTGVQSNVKFTHYLSVNGTVKESIIPKYKVENYTTEYFNEGLVFIPNCSVPLSTDAYSSYYYQNKAQMKNQYAVNMYNGFMDFGQKFFTQGPNAVLQSAIKGGSTGGGAKAGANAIGEVINQFVEMGNDLVDIPQRNAEIALNQGAKLADMGAVPDSLKQTGSDVFYDLMTCENNLFLNHYVIDELSYNSISKYLERVGYQVNLYDTLHVVDRVGWNFIQLNSFDYESKITVSQEDTIRKIFYEGVTLLHDKTYLTSGHNYETILDE